MFICESSLQFSTACIVDEDYPGIMGLGEEKKKKLKPFDVYLCTAYRCSNMELGPITCGKHKCVRKNVSHTSTIWLPVRLLLSDIHFQKGKFNRRLWCKSLAITPCVAVCRIKPSAHFCFCFGVSSIVPHPLDDLHISVYDCHQQRSMLLLCGSSEAEKVQRITNILFFSLLLFTLVC